MRHCSQHPATSCVSSKHPLSAPTCSGVILLIISVAMRIMSGFIILAEALLIPARRRAGGWPAAAASAGGAGGWAREPSPAGQTLSLTSPTACLCPGGACCEVTSRSLASLAGEVLAVGDRYSSQTMQSTSDPARPRRTFGLHIAAGRACAAGGLSNAPGGARRYLTMCHRA